MAVFLVNTCKFNSCGITFPTLTELIRHIEETHLDFDPRVIEEHELQQPSCLPISYILRVFTDNGRKESLNGTHQPRKLMRSHSPALSLCSTTPTGSEMEEEDNESDSGESSIDSWVNINVENDSANAILKIMSPQLSCQKSSNNSNCDEKDKPFVCMIGGCKKRYRNANGLKYHTKSTHNNNNNNTTAQKKEPLIGPSKVYKCQLCGKIYKTSHGLKNHNNLHHNNNNNQQQTQTQTQSQTQTPLTPTQAQPLSGIMSKTPVIASNSLSPTSKESILATFVRMKSLPSLPNTSSGSGVQLNRNGLDGLPLMLTLQTDSDNKLNSDSVNNDQKQGLNNENGIRKCPVMCAAPTLQQHLLSPIVGKSTISVTKIL